MRSVEKWGIFELSLTGKTEGNPYTDYDIYGEFSCGRESVRVTGFYDGDGTYRIRFMPSFEGSYNYTINGSALTDGEISGSFVAVPPTSKKNHGPVRVSDKVYFNYEDGTPYNSIGTTCYAWLHQTEELQKQTLSTLSESSFNKIRFCVFPKYYQYNEHEPLTYPYAEIPEAEQKPEQKQELMDFYSFNPEHFRRFDKRIAELAELGIEADIILFHPYDKWGLSTMGRECNELYLRYMIARYGAYRNVWWAMANEYDLLNNNGWTNEEWSAYGRLMAAEDPYNHLRSIHNCIPFFDHNEEWITHCSLQRQDFYRHAEYTDEYINKYNKPVVWDEICYEGNIDWGWGNISGPEMVRRFWETTVRGGACGHGETIIPGTAADRLSESETSGIMALLRANSVSGIRALFEKDRLNREEKPVGADGCEYPSTTLWWSHGGVLRGESNTRLAFLKRIWEEAPAGRLKHGEGAFDEAVAIPWNEEKICTWTEQTFASYELHYYGLGRPSFRRFSLPEGVKYHFEVIDTWNMTITDCGIKEGEVRIDMPGHEWMAIRMSRV